MSKIKVIIDSCHGIFEPKTVYSNLVKKCGYEDMWSIEARTDPTLVAFVENRSSTSHGITYMLGKEIYMYVQVVEVDTSRPWYISEYDGSESIRYLNYKTINHELNYGKLIE